MKNVLLICIVFVLSACETDSLIPCEGDGPTGEVCREYKYFNHSPTGYVDFTHDGDSLLIIEAYDQQHRLQKTVKEWFVNGSTSVIAEQYPDENTKVQTWHYNELDSLEAIVFGANDSSMHIIYENGKRKTESYIHGDSLVRYFTYRYFQDDGNLYRIYMYNAQDSLLSYRSFEYFSTGQNRVSYFTASNELVGRKVFRFSQNGLISSIEFTNDEGAVTERSDYIYDASFNLIEKTQSVPSGTYKSVFLYY